MEGWWHGYKAPSNDTLGAHPAATLHTAGGVTPRRKVQAAFTPNRYKDFLSDTDNRVDDAALPAAAPSKRRRLNDGGRTPDEAAAELSPASTGPPTASVAHKQKYVCRSACGFRKVNQDRSVMHVQPDATPPHSFYAVFDGHGGHKASEFCKEHLYANLLRDASWPEQPIDALKSAVMKTDEDFRKVVRASGAEAMGLDGSTAVCVLVLGSHIYVTNVGDSRAILLRSAGTVVQLSQDHKPTVLAEAVRIRQAGGAVTEGRVAGVLSVSRSIGDEKFSHWVTAKPDIRPFTIHHADDLIVMASDGLWDVMSNEDVLKHTTQELPESAERLIAEAVLRGSQDNITVLIVRVAQGFNDLPSPVPTPTSVHTLPSPAVASLASTGRSQAGQSPSFGSSPMLSPGGVFWRSPRDESSANPFGAATANPFATTAQPFGSTSSGSNPFSRSVSTTSVASEASDGSQRSAAATVMASSLRPGTIFDCLKEAPASTGSPNKKRARDSDGTLASSLLTLRNHAPPRPMVPRKPPRRRKRRMLTVLVADSRAEDSPKPSVQPAGSGSGKPLADTPEEQPPQPLDATTKTVAE